MSCLTHLKCSECGTEYSAEVLQTYCPACSAPLLCEYDLTQARKIIDRDALRQGGGRMWRWHELLPVRDETHIVSLGEGDTPLLALPEIGRQLGLENLLIKEESFNPTGTFKARGMAAAVSRARELKAERLIVPSAGNAGGALAAYAARAGIPCAVYIPKDTPAANIAEIQLMATEIVLVEGLISDAARFAHLRSQEGGWFDLSTFKEPYRLEGKKILGYEIAEALDWQLPDVIVYPTGGGTGLVGMVKAFHELASLGWLDSSRLPRMVAVQAEGCAPVVRAFELGVEACEFWTDAHTIASGLRVPKSFADRLILRSIRETDGTAVAVSDEEITLWQKRLAQSEGIFACPEGAATIAALPALLAKGWLARDEQVVVFNTGSGLKYLN